MNKKITSQNKYRELILVSQSPRRKDILQTAGYKFRTGTIEVSENLNKNMSLERAIQDVAQRKAEAYYDAHKLLKLKDILLISADTLVCLGEKALGKPQDFEQAVQFLRELSGRKHSVKTAICLFDCATEKVLCRLQSTEIGFRRLSEKEIHDYVATGEPMDKAGAYAIQGGGAQFVECIEGERDNVIGFPLRLFEEMLGKILPGGSK